MFVKPVTLYSVLLSSEHRTCLSLSANSSYNSKRHNNLVKSVAMWNIMRLIHAFYSSFTGQNESGIFKCPRGFYCPPGTGKDEKPCPLGSYSNSLGLSEERQCLPCDPGSYCAQLNLTAPSGNCSGGYYCVSGSHTATPQLTNLTHCPATYSHLSIGDRCPSGHYCPSGSKAKHGTLTQSYCFVQFHQKTISVLSSIAYQFCIWSLI